MEICLLFRPTEWLILVMWFGQGKCKYQNCWSIIAASTLPQSITSITSTVIAKKNFRKAENVITILMPFRRLFLRSCIFNWFFHFHGEFSRNNSWVEYWCGKINKYRFGSLLETRIFAASSGYHRLSISKQMFTVIFIHSLKTPNKQQTLSVFSLHSGIIRRLTHS